MAKIVYQGSDGIEKERCDGDALSFEEEIGHWKIVIGPDNDHFKYVPRERVYSVKF